MFTRNHPRSIHTELLFNLVFLASAAILIVGVTTLVISRVDSSRAFPAMVVLWVGSTAVFLGFGAYLVRRAVLDPLNRLHGLAEQMAAGSATAPCPPFGTREFDQLGLRMQEMAEQLLEAGGQNAASLEEGASWAGHAGRGP
ncbi:MAG: HAMP domain-containing protein [Gemmatimonadales bacterium]|nr:HAMP domain-containing protein [Gemmatimonadales bacterium]